MSQEGIYWESNLAKFLLLFINTILAIIGFGLSIIGIVGLCNKDLLKYLQVATVNNNIDLIKASSGLLIGLGVFVIVIAAFGLFGAIKGNIGLLTTVRKYIGILLFILLLQIIAAILSFVFQAKILNRVNIAMTVFIKESYGEKGKESLTEIYDDLQMNLKCCGAGLGMEDWRNSSYVKHHYNDRVPESCCKPDKDCIKTAGVDEIYTTSCGDALKELLKKHASILSGIAFGFIGFQVAILFIAIYLRSKIGQFTCSKH